MNKAATISVQVPSSGNHYRQIKLTIKDTHYAEPAQFSCRGDLATISLSKLDFLGFRRSLIKQGIIDNRYHWTFDEGHLVIIAGSGEGHDLVECLWLIYSLEEKAKESGGYIHLVLTTTFLSAIKGDWMYAQPHYADRAKDIRSRLNALYVGNFELWRWLLTKNMLVKIDNTLLLGYDLFDENTFCSISITMVNDKVKASLSNASGATEVDLSTNVMDPATKLQTYPYSILMNRVLEQYNVRKVVLGWAESDGICEIYDGRLVLVPASGFKLYRTNSK